MRPMTFRRDARRGCDPAPSRWAWRMQRLMLTPLFLLFLRAGLPMLATFSLATWWLSNEDNRQMVAQTVAEARASFETRPEFMVQLMSVDGASDALSEDIREVLPLDFPMSSFDLNLSAIRETVAGLPPVKSAAVRIKPGGVLHIAVEPRTPVAIWRSADGLTLVDVTGAHINRIPSRKQRPDLPLIAGEGAVNHVKPALELYRAAAPLGGRLRGLVRVGDRRWDVVLDRDQRILLPEDGAVEALDRVIALDGVGDVLARDIRRIDLRLAERPTVQMTKQATEQWWKIKNTSGQ